MDAEAIGQQAVDAWDPSDLPTEFSQPDNCPSSNLASGSNNNIIDRTNLGPREMTQGYHHAFGYYPLRPAPGFPLPPTSTISLPGTPFPNTPFGIPPPTLAALAPPQAPFVPPTTASPQAPFVPPSTAPPSAPFIQPTLSPTPVPPSNNSTSRRRSRGSGRTQGRERRGGDNAATTAGIHTSGADADEEVEEVGRPRKKGRNRNMTTHEKLVLIRECVEHAEEYRPGNKTKFWAMISDILKQHTGYELANPCQTVTRWVKAIIDELVEEEMGSGTEVERNNFKTAVETFAERMKIVATDISDSVKT